MASTVHKTSSERATRRVAARLAESLSAGATVALIGDLGAGKTCFVRGLARALGVPADVPITSPTFTVLNTYDQGRLPLYHFDLYRLADLDELEAIGYRDYLGGDGVAVLEWADRIPDALPASHIEIVITAGSAGNQRTITIARESC